MAQNSSSHSEQVNLPSFPAGMPVPIHLVGNPATELLDTPKPAMLPLRESNALGHAIKGGWIKYICPHKESQTYYYHPEMLLVTRLDVTQPTIQANVSKYCSKGRLCETWVTKKGEDDYKVRVVDHEAQLVYSDPTKLDQLDQRANYWVFMFCYPLHHKLHENAEGDATHALELMIAQNLTNSNKEEPCTPLSMEDIRGYIEFFEFTQKMDGTSKFEPSIAKVIIICVVLANYYKYGTAHKLTIPKPFQTTTWRKLMLSIACCGMPPKYGQRFVAAQYVCQRSLQPAPWRKFIDNIMLERAAMNVISGLLLASSIAFLAVPNLVNFAQFFIIVSIGCSLACVLMGFNGGMEQKLSKLRKLNFVVDRPEDDKKVCSAARAMEEHYTVLLVSVFMFFLAVAAYTVYNIRFTSSVKSTNAVSNAFFSMAIVALAVVVVFVFRWNRVYASLT